MNPQLHPFLQFQNALARHNFSLEVDYVRLLIPYLSRILLNCLQNAVVFFKIYYCFSLFLLHFAVYCPK